MKRILAALIATLIALSATAQETDRPSAPSMLANLHCSNPIKRRMEYVELRKIITSMLGSFGVVSPQKYGTIYKNLFPISSIYFVPQYIREMEFDKDRLAIVARFHIHRIQDRILLAQEANPTSVASEAASLMGIMEDFPALFHAALQQADVNKDNLALARHLSADAQALQLFMLRVSDLVRCIGNLPLHTKAQAQMQELRNADWQVSAARVAAQFKRDETLNSNK